MEALAGRLDKPDDAARFHAAADKLRAAYYKTFYNPATGVLAGWKSADGQLHDYYFLFVNGIAIHYGLVPEDKANAVMDKLLAKMKAVGYNRFDLGLPGNLVSIAPGDFLDPHERWGGGPNGFQKYENGGATGCFAYFTLAALYDLGRREEADRILFPMLRSFADGGFQGRAPDDLAYDWKDWKGKPHGYEGFLADNYYALLAVLVREGQLKGRRSPRRRCAGAMPTLAVGMSKARENHNMPTASVDMAPGDGPDPIFEKPQPITMAELAGKKIEGVEAVEVSDYAPAGYKGELKPSPPHADFNPQEGGHHRLGQAPATLRLQPRGQLLSLVGIAQRRRAVQPVLRVNEGGDLFSDTGRRERNSFVDVIQSGPDRAWVRWNYFCVSPRRRHPPEHPRHRGLHRLSQRAGVAAADLPHHDARRNRRATVGSRSTSLPPRRRAREWKDLFPRDPRARRLQRGRGPGRLLGQDLPRLLGRSRARPRRVGDAELLWQISKSKGFAMVMPFKAGHLFVVLGQSSGFPARKEPDRRSQLRRHRRLGLGLGRWDHWPVGWLNSQSHDYQPGSPYPYHFCPVLALHGQQADRRLPQRVSRHACGTWNTTAGRSGTCITRSAAWAATWSRSAGWPGSGSTRASDAPTPRASPASTGRRRRISRALRACNPAHHEARAGRVDRRPAGIRHVHDRRLRGVHGRDRRGLRHAGVVPRADEPRPLGRIHVLRPDHAAVPVHRRDGHAVFAGPAQAEGQSKRQLYVRVVRRVLLLWVLGMITQGHLLDCDPKNLQFFSNTLQAIAVGYLVASMALIHLSVRWQFLLTCVLLLGFWLLMMLVPSPGCTAGTLKPEANLARYVDEFVLRGFRDQNAYTWILSGLGFSATVLWASFRAIFSGPRGAAGRRRPHCCWPAVLALPWAGFGPAASAGSPPGGSPSSSTSGPARWSFGRPAGATCSWPCSIW